VIQSFSFELEPPEGWDRFQDGTRTICQGPKNEELIISGASVAGSGSVRDLEEIRRAVHANAVTAMARAVETPDLIVEWPIADGSTSTGVPYRLLVARSKDGEVMFLQAAVLGDVGALLLTLEAPPSAEGEAVFRQLVANVRETTKAAEDMVS
jgi:hypothetical protein